MEKISKSNLKRLIEFYEHFKLKRVPTMSVVYRLSSFSNRTQLYNLRPFLEKHGYHRKHSENFFEFDFEHYTYEETSSWWKLSPLGLSILAQQPEFKNEVSNIAKAFLKNFRE